LYCSRKAIKMKVLIERIGDLNDLVMQGASEEVLEQFYHDEIITQVNDDIPVMGKNANRKVLKSRLNDILEFKSAKPLKVTIGEQITMVEWHMNYKHKVLGERCYTQVAVHDWRDGKVIKEKLYCGNK